MVTVALPVPAALAGEIPALASPAGPILARVRVLPRRPAAGIPGWMRTAGLTAGAGTDAVAVTVAGVISTPLTIGVAMAAVAVTAAGKMFAPLTDGVAMDALAVTGPPRVTVAFGLGV